jgi:hypothetical protein
MRLALLAILFLGGCGPIVTGLEWGDPNWHKFDKVPRKPLYDDWIVPADRPSTQPIGKPEFRPPHYWPSGAYAPDYTS